MSYFKASSMQHTLYLVEPSQDILGPLNIPRLQTVITCSPDQRRYKEFTKLGAEKLYMPCWRLDELKVVAKEI